MGNLLAELNEERANSNRRKADIFRTHVTSLISPSERQLAEVVREATYEAEEAARLGNEAFARARSGMELGAAKRLLAATIGSLEAGSDFADIVRSLYACQPDLMREVMPDYEVGVKKVTAVLAQLRRLAEMYDRPRKPIDQERLRRGMEQVAAGKVKNIDDMIVELRARRG